MKKFWNLLELLVFSLGLRSILTGFQIDEVAVDAAQAFIIPLSVIRGRSADLVMTALITINNTIASFHVPRGSQVILARQILAGFTIATISRPYIRRCPLFQQPTLNNETAQSVDQITLSSCEKAPLDRLRPNLS